MCRSPCRQLLFILAEPSQQLVLRGVCSLHGAYLADLLGPLLQHAWDTAVSEGLQELGLRLCWAAPDHMPALLADRYLLTTLFHPSAPPPLLALLAL